MRVHSSETASTADSIGHTFLSSAVVYEPELLRQPTSHHFRACGPTSLTEYSRCVHGVASGPTPVAVVTDSPVDTAIAPARPAGVPPEFEAARPFAEHTVRLLFEVLDRRRSVEQLALFLTPSMVELARTLSVRALPGSRLGSATLRRLHVVTNGHRGAEIFGSYSRGDRLFAVAGRIELRNTPRRNTWTLTSVRIC